MRALQEGDVEALVALEQASQPLPWSEQALRDELTHPDAIVLGLTDGQGLVGYVALRTVVDELWILNIAVHPRARRQGHAGMLMEAARAHTVRTAGSSLWLEVREGNAAARALYLRHGLTVRGRRPNYYPPVTHEGAREAAILMALDLANR
jgi:ribosomal-protein-alanine N-acetyltransferase